MKTLIILRHAKTEEKKPGQKDFDRELLSRGKENATETAKVIQQSGWMPEIIYCSTAQRTRQTAAVVSDFLGIQDANIDYISEIYEADLKTLLSVIQSIPAHIQTAMLVGHNPSVTYISAYLTGEAIDHVPTSGAVVISLSDWSALKPTSNKLLFFHQP